MKKVLAIMMLAIAVVISTNSCETGFSKGTYISALERFVNSVEQDYQGFDETDWQRADQRMTAFSDKYGSYADQFTTDDKRKVSKLMTKYQVIRGKAKVSGVVKDIGNIIDQGAGVLEGLMEGIDVNDDNSEEK